MILPQPIILFALRYCLYSASYAPATCTMYLIEHWAEFEADFQAQILTEIQNRLASNLLDHELVEIWEGVIVHANAMLSRES